MPFLTGTMYMIALAGPFYIMSWLPARYLVVFLFGGGAGVNLTLTRARNPESDPVDTVSVSEHS